MPHTVDFSAVEHIIEKSQVDFDHIWRHDAKLDSEVFVSYLARHGMSAECALKWLANQECCHTSEVFKTVRQRLERLQECQETKRRASRKKLKYLSTHSAC